MGSTSFAAVICIFPRRIDIVAASLHLSHDRLMIAKELCGRIVEHIVDDRVLHAPAIPPQCTALTVLSKQLLAREQGNELFMP